ncbi:MAG: MFS transporter [Vulcanimicrobiaceae bacterium]
MNRRFFLLWTGQTISAFGSQISLLAIPTIAILILHATPAQTGLLGTIAFLWFPILGLSVGVLADRRPRRPILIVADIVRGGALLCIPIALGFHVLTMTTLYVLSGIIGIASVFFEITYQSYLPQVVAPDFLIHANARLQMSASAAELGGMPIAGLLIGVLGAARAVVFDALSFFFSALSIAFMPADTAANTPASGSPLQMVREGIAVVMGTPIIRYTTICTAILNLGSGINLALWLQYAYRILHLTPIQVGFIGAFGASGMFVASALTPRIGKALGIGKTMMIAVSLTILSSSLIPLAAFGNALIILALSNFVADIHTVLYNITQVSLRQRLVPVYLQGRMNATIRTIVWGALPVGSILGGLAAQQFGIYPVLFAGIGFAVAATALVAFSPILRYREPATFKPGQTG